MRTLIAGFAFLSLFSLAHAETKSETELKRLTAHYSDTEKVLAMFVSWEVINSHCKSQLNRSIYGTPGTSTLLIAEMLAKLSTKLPPGRAAEIYDVLWTWVEVPTSSNRAELVEACDIYQADAEAFLKKLNSAK
jgi:hypothetical protein